MTTGDRLRSVHASCARNGFRAARSSTEERRLQAAVRAPDGFAGGKLAKVDRVEWLVIPDSNTAVQALIKGEVDIIEIPQTDLLPLIRKDPNITVKVIDRVGTQAIYRMNHLIPPFNNAKARQALLYATGDPEGLPRLDDRLQRLRAPCWAVFVCGTPFETQAGVGDWAKGRQEGEHRERRSSC
jgi:peptide/nickel transport system substrate-binding protein